MQVISTASRTSVATTDAIFDCHDSSDNLFQKSYCTSRGLQLYLFERNVFSPSLSGLPSSCFQGATAGTTFGSQYLTTAAVNKHKRSQVINSINKINNYKVS